MVHQTELRWDKKNNKEINIEIIYTHVNTSSLTPHTPPSSDNQDLLFILCIHRVHKKSSTLKYHQYLHQIFTKFKK